MVGSDGLIEFANAEAERMFGYETGELLGKPIDSLVPPPTRHAHAALRKGFVADPSRRLMGVGRDLKAMRRDGSVFSVEIGLTPIETKGGMVVLATVLDITARRNTEIALAQRAAELERANERLLQFAYVASHDLQEPLRKIAAFSDLLEQAVAAADPSEIGYATQVIRTSALRARDLVDDLLTYSRSINDAQQLEDLDLREEISLALEDLSATIEKTDSEIEIDVPRKRFRADRSMFARLILNIVSNAIKYRRPDEQAKVRIVATPVDEGALRLAVIDNGIGFEEKYATMIWEPFKRLEPKAKYPGTGIGLAICKSIADRHGWELSVKSKPGEGATFYIVIPALA